MLASEFDPQLIMAALVQRAAEILHENKQLYTLKRPSWHPRHKVLRLSRKLSPVRFGQAHIAARGAARAQLTRLMQEYLARLDRGLREIERVEHALLAAAPATISTRAAALRKYGKKFSQPPRKKPKPQKPLSKTQQAHRVAQARQTQQLLSSKSKGTYTALQRDLRAYYHRAFQLGLASSGHPQTTRPTQEEERWVESAWADESKYLLRLCRQIGAGQTADNLHWRVKMYPKVLSALFDAGRVSGGHPETLYYWVVDQLAEHCPDCVYLQSQSPFTPRTLPTTPGASLCQCRGNCKCSLRSVQVSPGVIRRREQESPSRLQLVNTIRARQRGAV